MKSAISERHAVTLQERAWVIDVGRPETSVVLVVDRIVPRKLKVFLLTHDTQMVIVCLDRERDRELMERTTLI